ncbi:MAG TPA: VWA domain-containing protein [Bryobacteraceae bacterium]|nr:VWA domain-containing protein [Bryobacteraceae bacterium]
MTLRRRTIVLPITLAGGILTALLMRGQDPVFRSDVALVRVDAQVTDGLKAIDGLEKGDFVIKDNGVKREILYCSQDEQSLDLMLLFDISDSMYPGIRRLAASAHTALTELRQGDRVALADFNTQSWLITPFNDNLEEVEESVSRVVDLRFGGGTFILSAINDAAQYFAKHADRQRRRAILIFTDDDGQPSASEKKVVDRMWESDVLLCGLIIPTPGSLRHGRIGLPSESMRGVAAKTGGEVVDADNPGHAFREMLHRIRKRYSIYYEMPRGVPGKAREVSVELSEDAKGHNPEARVLARKGYVIPKSGTQ